MPASQPYPKQRLWPREQRTPQARWLRQSELHKGFQPYRTADEKGPPGPQRISSDLAARRGVSKCRFKMSAAKSPPGTSCADCGQGGSGGQERLCRVAGANAIKEAHGLQPMGFRGEKQPSRMTVSDHHDKAIQAFAPLRFGVFNLRYLSVDEQRNEKARRALSRHPAGQPIGTWEPTQSRYIYAAGGVNLTTREEY